MAEENAQASAQEQEPHGTEPTDWEAKLKELEGSFEKLKGESRKWEERSKANAAAAKELDQLKKAQMTDQQRMEAETNEAKARAEEAEADLQRITREAEQAKNAAELSEAYGVPASVLTADTTTKEGMEALAKAVAALVAGRPSAPVFAADGKRPGKKPRTPQEEFGDFLGQIMK